MTVQSGPLATYAMDNWRVAAPKKPQISAGFDPV
jgi:hypothetical protein